MKTVLFFISSTRHSCRDRLSGVLKYARTKNWYVHVVERVFQRVAVKELLEFWKPVGVIVECGSGADEMNQSAFGSLPVVYLDRDPAISRKDFVVMLDSRNVGRMAAAELSKFAVKSYGYVPSRARQYWSKERGDAFVASLRKRGHCSIVFSWPSDRSDNRRVAALVKWLDRLEKPCAVFAANDNTSEYVLAAAAKKGLHVPDDLVLLGVDNEVLVCENSDPPLSSIAPNFEEMAYHAAKLLNDLISGKRPRKRVYRFQAPCIVRRKSTRAKLDGCGECYSTAVRAAFDFIAEHGDGGLSVSDVVKAVGCSRRLIEVRFRKETGLTLLEAIHRRLCERATELIAKPGMSLQVVADILSVSLSTVYRLLRMKRCA